MYSLGCPSEERYFLSHVQGLITLTAMCAFVRDTVTEAMVCLSSYLLRFLLFKREVSLATKRQLGKVMVLLLIWYSYHSSPGGILRLILQLKPSFTPLNRTPSNICFLGKSLSLKLLFLALFIS